MLAPLSLLIALAVDGAASRPRTQELAGRLGLGRRRQRGGSRERFLWVLRNFPPAVHGVFYQLVSDLVGYDNMELDVSEVSQITDQCPPNAPAVGLRTDYDVLFTSIARYLSGFPGWRQGGALNYVYQTAGQVSDWVRAERPDISAMTWPQMVEATEAWHAQLQGAPSLPGVRRGTLVFSFDDGWTVRALTERKDLEAEGDYLSHCVATYWPSVIRGTSRIFSLRDPSGAPVLTIELYLGNLRQALGDRNRHPSAAEEARVQVFLAHQLAEGRRALVDALEKVHTFSDGSTIYRVPPAMFPRMGELFRYYATPYYMPNDQFVVMEEEGTPAVLLAVGDAGRTDSATRDVIVPGGYAWGPSQSYYFQILASQRAWNQTFSPRDYELIEQATQWLFRYMGVPMPSWGQEVARNDRYSLWWISPEQIPMYTSARSERPDDLRHGELSYVGKRAKIPRATDLPVQDRAFFAVRDAAGYPLLVFELNLHTGKLLRLYTRGADTKSDAAARHRRVLRWAGRTALAWLEVNRLSIMRQAIEAFPVKEITPLPSAASLSQQIRDLQRGQSLRLLDPDRAPSVFLDAVSRASALADQLGVHPSRVFVELSGGSDRRSQSDPQSSTFLRWDKGEMSVGRQRLLALGALGNRYLPRLVVKVMAIPTADQEAALVDQGLGHRDGFWWVIEDRILMPRACDKSMLAAVRRVVDVAHITYTSGRVHEERPWSGTRGFVHPRSAASMECADGAAGRALVIISPDQGLPFDDPSFRRIFRETLEKSRYPFRAIWSHGLMLIYPRR